MKSDTVVLCPLCVPMSCCPTIKKSEGKFLITDDYGDSISLKASEAIEVVKKINELSSLPRTSLDN